MAGGWLNVQKWSVEGVLDGAKSAAQDPRLRRWRPTTHARQGVGGAGAALPRDPTTTDRPQRTSWRMGSPRVCVVGVGRCAGVILLAMRVLGAPASARLLA